ncbi:LOW QUALITY PROTEIN: B_lectin domain-containing protein/Pkinase_Tyr domain-containing protein, partial [Cephalotus follicularis]
SLTRSLVLTVLCCFSFFPSLASDTLIPGQSLDNGETLVSAGGVFELGFFASGINNNNYLGIWVKNDPNKKPVWVANRDNPIFFSSGVLSIRYDGNLVITDARLTTILVNIGNLATSNNTIAKILDSGNLLLLDGEEIVWQSFDYPTDTILPGMKVGWVDVGTNLERKPYLSSWVNQSNPSTGPFMLGLDQANQKQFNELNLGVVQRVVALWDGQIFRFFINASSLNFSFFSNGKDAYFTTNTSGNYVSSWLVLASNGDLNEYKMTETEISMVAHPLCDGTKLNGCEAVPYTCIEGEFSEIRGSMPNSTNMSAIYLGPSECKGMCRNTCTCSAFASQNGLCLYFGDKTDLLNTSGEGNSTNSTINVRNDDPTISGQKGSRTIWWIITIPTIAFFILISSSYLLWRKCNSRDIVRLSGTDAKAASFELGGGKDHELPLLSFSCIAIATDSFSNKLGEGGFGPVYKGKLSGQDIAVKRLSKTSGQGVEELKNEVQLISKLQHRNLVKLLGCCIQPEEKILIYEYMPNKSLDAFIFEAEKRSLLGWKQRLHIIEGIAQGLLYLHMYSRLKIIHRDLKTSNILLDSYMNPKISDFGMARIFGDNESRVKTKRIAGTYGYLSPEYALHGIFSTKSDVFSFGVILLEIVSGKSVTTYCDSQHSYNLLGHAWELWSSGQCTELMDSTLAASCSVNEVVQCIQVGLLCVQDKAEDRPTTSNLVSMLSNEGALLPAPKQPAFSI